MKKKILGILLSIVTVTILFSGCRNTKAGMEETVNSVEKGNANEETRNIEVTTHNASDTVKEDLMDNSFNDNSANTITEKLIEYEALLEPDSNTHIFYEADMMEENNEVKKDELENLIGEYDYVSDYGMGKLIIKKTSYGYDISDYESESSYRFLADSSNIETIENNRIYIKYPEQVCSDDTVIFSYYILEYSTDEINVYYGKSILEEAQFLYHATKKKEEDTDK